MLTREEVREEWDKLIANVNARTSVKKILDYLHELEIDTSEIELKVEKEQPMLPAAPIKMAVLKL